MLFLGETETLWGCWVIEVIEHQLFANFIFEATKGCIHIDYLEQQ